MVVKQPVEKIRIDFPIVEITFAPPVEDDQPWLPSWTLLGAVLLASTGLAAAVPIAGSGGVR
jgi:hypothetical protein